MSGEPTEVIEPREEPPAARAERPSGVFIPYAPEENGRAKIGVEAWGDVRETEVLTLLEKAIPLWRQMLGLPPR